MEQWQPSGTTYEQVRWASKRACMTDEGFPIRGWIPFACRRRRRRLRRRRHRRMDGCDPQTRPVVRWSARRPGRTRGDRPIRRHATGDAPSGVRFQWIPWAGGAHEGPLGRQVCTSMQGSDYLVQVLSLALGWALETSCASATLERRVKKQCSQHKIAGPWGGLPCMHVPFNFWDADPGSG